LKRSFKDIIRKSLDIYCTHWKRICKWKLRCFLEIYAENIVLPEDIRNLLQCKRQINQLSIRGRVLPLFRLLQYFF